MIVIAAITAITPSHSRTSGFLSRKLSWGAMVTALSPLLG
jgi:hypothetical protein